MKKILLIISIFFITLFFNLNVYAKYVIEEKYEVINIKKADSDKPYINNRNYDVDYENFNTDVTINYIDNLKIKYAKYWFNENEKVFEGDGIDFESGTTFNKSGFYKVEVSDMYNNKTIYIFIIDKEVNLAKIESDNLSDSGANIKITANDFVSGIKKIDLYINNSIYKTFLYEEKFLKEKIEEIYVNIDNLPFYEEAYILVTDFYGNTLKSNIIIPNKSRIYDLQDFVKFRDVVNSGIDSFKNQGIYLLNPIDLSSICSSSNGNWIPIGTSKGVFSGIFEGNNYQISNLYINSSSSYLGLFKTVNGVIQNLRLSGNILNAGGNSGGFAGALNSGAEIKNCRNYVKVNGKADSTGGIAGIIHNLAKVSYCINYSNITGLNFTGGIVRIQSRRCN